MSTWKLWKRLLWSVYKRGTLLLSEPLEEWLVTGEETRRQWTFYSGHEEVYRYHNNQYEVFTYDENSVLVSTDKWCLEVPSYLRSCPDNHAFSSMHRLASS